MNPDPDYSAAYVTLRTDDGGADGTGDGYGLVFTIGRGNEVAVAADRRTCHPRRRDARSRSTRAAGGAAPPAGGRLAAAMARPREGRHAHGDRGRAERRLGPRQPACRDAAVAVHRIVDARSNWSIRSTSVTSPTRSVRDEALAILQRAEPGRSERVKRLLECGYPAYTTSAGWLGYDDAKVERLARQAVADGFTLIKLKVGADLADDERRVRLVRETVGPDIELAIDANQRWDVADAIDWVGRLAPYGLRWIEEPTSPDDVLGMAKIAARRRPDRGRHRRARGQPSDVQATAAGRGDLGPAARRLPCRRRQREPGDPVAGRQVRRAGVPARRRRRPVRARPAPGDGRLSSPSAASSTGA